MGSLPQGLNIELHTSDALYQKNEKQIRISVDDKVKWSYKWTDTFEPSLGQSLLVPPASTVRVSLIGTHRVRRHLLGSYSACVSDFFNSKETSLPLRGGGRAT
ncbi:hypothetical protein PAXRUDRAFT_578599, partial [Paxillus rubicundulus Ve08.2h10]